MNNISLYWLRSLNSNSLICGPIHEALALTISSFQDHLYVPDLWKYQNQLVSIRWIQKLHRLKGGSEVLEILKLCKHCRQKLAKSQPNTNITGCILYCFKFQIDIGFHVFIDYPVCRTLNSFEVNGGTR